MRADAEPPSAKVLSLLDGEPRFKHTWEQEREDLRDSSPSGYDFSLTNIAISAGWSDQEICNLLIAWRRKHGHDLKLRDDYYARTIANAKQTRFKERSTDKSQRRKGRRELNAGDKDFARITPLAWEALNGANDPPRLFRSGGVASRLEYDDGGFPMLKELDEHRMTNELTEAVHWYIEEKTTRVRSDATPPTRLVNNLLSSREVPLPVLTRIVTAPVFSTAGKLETGHGYHTESRTFCHQLEGFCLRSVRAHPTPSDIERARATIVKRLLGDFPFISNSERAHAVALLLLPFARELFEGPTPLHEIESPMPGSGKGLLADVLALPSTLTPSRLTEAGNEEEWRKRITSTRRAVPSFVIIDNVGCRLESSQLASALTSTVWEDRLLGLSRNIRLPIRCAIAVTANNPSFSMEIMRRCVRIRIDSKTDRPWLRDKFQEPDLRKFAIENRNELVWSALVMIQAWIAEGRPLFKGKKLGSFERWSEVMGGILGVVGVPGFLENLNEFYEEADTDGTTLRQFVAEWWVTLGAGEVTTSQLWKLSARDLFELGEGTEQSQKIRFGKMIALLRDRHIEQFCIKRGGKVQRAVVWYLEWTGDGEPPETCAEKG